MLGSIFHPLATPFVCREILPFRPFTPVPSGKRSPTKSRLRQIAGNDFPPTRDSGEVREISGGSTGGTPPRREILAARPGAFTHPPKSRRTGRHPSHRQPISPQALERRLGQRNLREPCRSRLSPPPNLRGPSPSRLSVRKDFFRSYPTELSARRNLLGTPSHSFTGPLLLATTSPRKIRLPGPSLTHSENVLRPMPAGGRTYQIILGLLV